MMNIIRGPFLILTVVLIAHLGGIGFDLIYQIIIQGVMSYSSIVKSISAMFIFMFCACVIGLIVIDIPTVEDEDDTEKDGTIGTLTDNEFMVLAECLNDWSYRLSQIKWLELLEEKYGSSAQQMMQTVQGLELEREADRLVKETAKIQGDLMISHVANLSPDEKSGFFEKLEISPGNTMDWLIQQIATTDNGVRHETT